MRFGGWAAGTLAAMLGAASLMMSAGSMTALANPSPQRGGTLDIALTGDALTLDPMLTTDEYSKPVESLLYNSLVTQNAKGDIVGDLAHSWTISKDGLTYTFNLRRNVYFHDGSKMTAKDVVFSFQRIMDKKLASPWASFFQPVKSVRALDPYTVQVQLKQPDAPFLTVVSSFLVVMNPSFVRAHNGNLQRVEDGTGPYELSKWVPNQTITLKRNPKYFVPGHPYLDSVVFHVIPTITSQIAALQSGQVQFAEFIDPSYYGQLEALAQAKTISTSKFLDSNYHLLGLNTKWGPFKNQKVRLALSYAINREQLVKGPGFGEGAVTGILTQALSKWAIPTSEYPSYQTNIAKAKELLKEAGYPNGFTFSIMAPSSFQTDLNSAVMIQSQLQAIGVTAKVVPTEWGTYVHNWVIRKFNAFTGENGDWTDPDLAMYAALHTGGSTNAFQFSNPEVDKLLDEGRTTLSFKKRYAIYAKLQKLVVEQAPMIYTFASYDMAAYSPALRGWQHIPGNDYRSFANAWFQK